MMLRIQAKTRGGISFTRHAEYKMREYRVSRQRALAVMRRPDREEVGILPGTVAAIHRLGSRARPHELWVMYQKESSTRQREPLDLVSKRRVNIISVWRYPGRSSERDPVPAHIWEALSQDGETLSD